MSPSPTTPSVRVATCSAAQLLASTPNFPDADKEPVTGKLVIPEYQRPYVWGETEVNKLLNDLREYQQDSSPGKPAYYLGSIILHEEDGHLNIIDGQQRVLTLLLLRQIDGYPLPGVEVRHPQSRNNLLANHALLKAKASSLRLQALWDNLNLTLVMTTSVDDAYTFFETQNTGGVRLGGTDIIKAHHLRAAGDNEAERSPYARRWEQVKDVKTLADRLLRARRWNRLAWQDIPGYLNDKGKKNAIVQDFSEKTRDKAIARRFFLASSSENTAPETIELPGCRYDIRQPLVNGINFVGYLEAYGELRHRLFVENIDPEISPKFYQFRWAVIDPLDGTGYLKEWYEAALLFYVGRFGFAQLTEAALWLFRSCYAPRVINPKTVREESVPVFIRDTHHLLDLIQTSYDHEELIGVLRAFQYELKSTEVHQKTVKGRFVERVMHGLGNAGFSVPEKKDGENSALKQYDETLIERINAYLS